MKKQKGITLIALIITIIVMLILVGVSVSVALNGGLFKTAKEAAEKTKVAVQEEASLKYEYEIAKATGKFIGDYDTYVLQEKYGLKIGDKVNYNEGTGGSYTTDASKGTGVSYTSNTLVQGTYTLTEAGDLDWRVLGINDEGQVELISTTPTECELTLYGKAGYLNAVTENGVRGTLDTFCNNIYGKGTGAESARSLTVEDINKLANKTSELPINYTFKYVSDYCYFIETSKITPENKDTTTGWTMTMMTEISTTEWKIDSETPGPENIDIFSLRWIHSVISPI